MQRDAAGGKGDRESDGNQAIERVPKRKCCCRKPTTTTKRERTYTRRWRGAMPGAYGTWHGCLPAWGATGSASQDSETTVTMHFAAILPAALLAATTLAGPISKSDNDTQKRICPNLRVADKGFIRYKFKFNLQSPSRGDALF
jgi:hypothetical protein